MKKAIEKNIEYSDKYKQKITDTEIPKMIQEIVNNKKIIKIIDLGCGDGGLISSIDKKRKDKKIWGVDISPRRISYLKKKFNKYKFFCKDICSTDLKENFFDLIISTQVIEHVGNDEKLVKEMYKILKKNGYLYVSSVIKKPFAIYQYRNKGKFVLDPTHEREYGSKKEFAVLFKDKFKLIKLKIYPVERKKIIKFKVPGYYIIETLWKK